MKANTPEFDLFLADFENLYTNISKNNFNGHSLSWWPNGEGHSLNNLSTTLDRSQLISEPTNFKDNKFPSCIYLIICDQPNVVMESGVRPSPDNICKHQMTFCNLT